MDLTWQIYGIKKPEKEYRFHPKRQWRFDYAWPDKNGGGVACEIEGGVWTRGRHTRGGGFVKDLEKYNEATKLGWKVLRFTPQDLKSGKAQMFMKEVIV